MNRSKAILSEKLDNNLLTAGCEILRLAAARVTLPVFATASNACSCRNLKVMA
jgi:hypothetical protein